MRRFGVLLVVAVAGCGDGGSTETISSTDVVQPTAPAPPPPVHKAGSSPKELFAENCGSCHTLAAAGVNGVVGPNLDKVRPDAKTVRDWIRSGSTDGVMPTGLLDGRDARRVAAYVARVAGR